MSDDTPVSCELYDQLKAIATQKKECHLTYFDNDDKLVAVCGQIVDVYAADNSDWCRFSDNTIIRLDRIEAFEQN